MDLDPCCISIAIVLPARLAPQTEGDIPYEAAFYRTSRSFFFICSVVAMAFCDFAGSTDTCGGVRLTAG